jgi:hypothetical protein
VDFVVVGFGLGALGVLLGVVMLGWLAPRTQRAAARASSPDDAARCQAIAAGHRGTGQALLYSGGAMLLVTVAGLVGSLDDRTGAFLVTTTATVAAVGILVAGYVQRTRNPVPSRRRTRTAPAAGASMGTPPPINTPSFFAGEPAWGQDVAPAESNSEGPSTKDSPEGDSGGEATLVEELTPSRPAASSEDSSGAIGPDPPGVSSIAVETPTSGSWQPADRTSGNGSEDTDYADTVDAKDVGHAAPSTRLTKPLSSRADEEDPSSGHQS